MTNVGGFTGSTSLIDLVVHDWKTINLPKLRSKLDERLETIYKETESSKNKRKKLANDTKEFGKSNKDDKLKKSWIIG